ncbi:Bst1p KNAG_0E03300 [Huiozyma naganishii CBS 8797]|uniref:GPI inositol-deacylase n=1 Tax=Huiozyma naganishii (strain ATCC MYA-139 / BCRC 22969 / CBS 8797 / KCTC 17520 / NBRC 10181 / NCYC 3082 / Yp74L-3) TaxID=1071383 RepID=J7S6U9_HUIN7|nr:hypothetical protein KNAG_0E03300 [Kazachstania naganishii CBS 8797]CCK70589.1 hypothetical protein KNAG_0E03300 [Kazachstania naganishii CBS 8797]
MDKAFRTGAALVKRLLPRKRKEGPRSSSYKTTTQDDQDGNYNRTFTYVSFVGIFMSLLLLLTAFLMKYEGADSSQCTPVWMYPSYAKIEGFDTKYTPLAQKYHLYLYREQDLDKVPLESNEIQLDGIPVLFIPGNAGSFKQGRSIASEAANIYFKSKGILENQVNTRNLDFFIADFNEDFTAFHGKTLMDQAEYLNDAVRYILSLYEESYHYEMVLPQSVILLGHSMGGIVARTMLALENHLPGSVYSIYTLSSPHAASPVTFDGDILKIYGATDKYWRAQLGEEDSFFSRNVSLVSITGGISDEILPADYATVADLIPPENGFSTFTTTIPSVWTPIDHLAIVWCEQLRHVIAKLLLESVDSNTSSKVKPLSERISLAKKHLLSGFEDYATEEGNVRRPEESSHNTDTTYSSGVQFVGENETLVIESTNYDTIQRFIRMDISKVDRDNDALKFTLLTSVEKPEVLFCQNFARLGSSANVKCVNAKNDINTVPRSTKDEFYPADSSWGKDQTPFKMLHFSGQDLRDYDFIIIKKPKRNILGDNGWLTATVSFKNPDDVVLDTPLLLSLRSRKLAVPSQENFVSQTWIFPNLWNSLVSYRLTIFAKDTDGSDNLFEPFIRQATFEPFETKWHINVAQNKKVDISMHNVSPYIPIDETQSRHLSLNIIVPPNMDISLKLKVNVFLTLKLLFIRYRLAIPAFLAVFVSLVLGFQFNYYRKSANFISFPDALGKILKSYGVVMLIVLFLMSPITNNKLVQKIFSLIDPVGLNKPFLLEEYHIYNNYYYLGIRDIFTSWIGPLFGVMTVGALFTLCKLIDFVAYLIGQLSEYIYKDTNEKETLPTWSGRDINVQVFDKKRILTCIMLLVAVVFYVPYQLIFMITVLIQLGTCVRIAYLEKHSVSTGNETIRKRQSNLINYNISILLLLTVVAIIDTPIVVVFLHDLAIRWESTFNSHHNIFAVLPILLLVTANSKFKIPTFSGFVDSYIITGLFFYLSFFSTIYGVRNLFWIHHLVNIICGWLFYGVFTNQ